VDLREEFVLKANDPSRVMSELCREYGISRKTGYVWLERYKTHGVDGLVDRSHRPRRLPSTTSGEVVLRISELRREKRFWGPKKLRELLMNEFGEAPSVRTIMRITKRLGLAALRTKRVRKPVPFQVGGTPKATRPNDVWTIDFKGWWKTRDGARFEPLTVRDAASRFVLLCTHCPETVAAVKRQCELLFQRYGVPSEIRADNGPPFAVSNAIGGLSRLSAWWTSLGIKVSFCQPASPWENGAHERMHADIARELQAEPARSREAQQRAVDVWVREYNDERPHEGINMKTPSSIYKRSRRPMKLLKPTYPGDAVVKRVSSRGRIKLDGHDYFIGTNLTGMTIGLRKVDSGFRVLFFNTDLGVIDPKPQRAR
jgi:transposase InsO family protein